MPNLHAQLKEVLDSSDGERRAHTFLKDHPGILMAAFDTGNNTRLISSEFRFGNQYRADFCILSGHSAGWEVHLIELEPVGAKFFLRDGTDSKILRKAKTQLEDWNHFIEMQEDEFRRQLAADILKRNLFYPEHNDLHDYQEPQIRSRDYSFDIDFYIVLGRRRSLEGDDIRRRSYYHKFQRVNLVTYDRLLEKAAMLDRVNREYAEYVANGYKKSSKAPDNDT